MEKDNRTKWGSQGKKLAKSCEKQIILTFALERMSVSKYLPSLDGFGKLTTGGRD
jgi:hypothetical protein